MIFVNGSPPSMRVKFLYKSFHPADEYGITTEETRGTMMFSHARENT